MGIFRTVGLSLLVLIEAVSLRHVHLLHMRVHEKRVLWRPHHPCSMDSRFCHHMFERTVPLLHSTQLPMWALSRKRPQETVILNWKMGLGFVSRGFIAGGRFEHTTLLSKSLDNTILLILHIFYNNYWLRRSPFQTYDHPVLALRWPSYKCL